MKFAPCVLIALLVFQSCLILDGSFHEKEIDGISLSMDDNPGLRRSYRAFIDQSSRTIYLSVPDYVDAQRLVPHVTYNGMFLAFDGEPWTKGDPVDLTQNRNVTVMAKDDTWRDYDLVVAQVPASSDKSIVSLTGYIRAAPASYWVFTFQQQDDQSWQSEYLASHTFPTSQMYLQINTTGVKVEVDGRVLLQGTRWEPELSSNLWNFTQTSVLTVTAEDLSVSHHNLVVKRIP